MVEALLRLRPIGTPSRRCRHAPHQALRQPPGGIAAGSRAARPSWSVACAAGPTGARRLLRCLLLWPLLCAKSAEPAKPLSAELAPGGLRSKPEAKHERILAEPLIDSGAELNI